MPVDARDNNNSTDGV